MASCLLASKHVEDRHEGRVRQNSFTHLTNAERTPSVLLLRAIDFGHGVVDGSPLEGPLRWQPPAVSVVDLHQLLHDSRTEFASSPVYDGFANFSVPPIPTCMAQNSFLQRKAWCLLTSGATILG